MAIFDFLKNYKLASKDLQPDPKSKHVFYSVEISSIIDAESKLGFLFPSELDFFYKEIGYGFLNHDDKRGNFNRFMPPADVAAINLRNEPYENDPDLEVYNDPDKMIFFELSEGVYLTINIDNREKKSAVFYFEDKIAYSIEEFIHKYEEDPDFVDEYE